MFRATLLTMLVLPFGASAFGAYPQNVQAVPELETTVASGTIAAGGSFQLAAAADPTRRGCTLVNTSANTMYVYTSASGTPTIANSIPVAAGQPFYCTIDTGVLTDPIYVETSTTGDTYALNIQHAR